MTQCQKPDGLKVEYRGLDGFEDEVGPEHLRQGRPLELQDTYERPTDTARRIVVPPAFSTSHVGRARDPQTKRSGKPWFFATDEKVSCQPAVGRDGAVYFGTKGGALHGVDPGGCERFNVNIDDKPVRHLALSRDGTIHAATMDGVLHLHDGRTGAELKTMDVGDPIVNLSVGRDDTLYVGTLSGKLLAFAQGAALWNEPFKQIGAVAPSIVTVAVGRHFVAAGSADGGLHVVDRSGVPQRIATRIFPYHPGDIRISQDNQKIFVASGTGGGIPDHGIYCFHPHEEEPIWHVPLTHSETTPFLTFAAPDEKTLGVVSGRKLRILDAETGRGWSVDFPDSPACEPIIIGRKALLMPLRDGRFFLVHKDTREIEEWKPATPLPRITNVKIRPTLGGDGRLFVPGDSDSQTGVGAVPLINARNRAPGPPR